ncbi:MAG: universal stress protein [Acidimicrobiales bacterium]|jgi:nucleotide-binding universal stress UspA family protein|nr:universal stress protein [Acidimicrobiales bacterium]
MPSLRNIVVPLDGSTLSESALPVAAELAAHFDAAVTLLSSGWGSTTDELHDYVETAGARLDVPTWTTRIAVDTFPATAIAEAAEADDTVVVMATHGRSGIGKALLGSVAEDVLKASARPVLLLGRNASPQTSLDGGAMIVATDGSETAESIVADAVAWARALHLSVRIVSVTTGDGTPVGGAADSSAIERLDALGDLVRAAGVEAHVERVEAKDAAGALVDLARNLPASMIAMATHGRTGLARTALGSTAMKVVRDAPCPVLVHRPGS